MVIIWESVGKEFVNINNILKKKRISVADYTAKCVENISKVLSQTGSVLTKVFGEKDNPFPLKNERLAIR